MTIEELLEGSGLAEKAVRLDENLVRMQWGSAFVIAGSPAPPSCDRAAVPRGPEGPGARVLQEAARAQRVHGGMASFALQPDGWVVLHAGRALKGIDSQEFATLVAGVGRFADQFDDQLIAEFYADGTPDAVASTANSGEFPATD